MQRYKIVKSKSEPGAYNILNLYTGRYVLENETHQVCQNVFSALDGRIPALVVSEAEEIAENIRLADNDFFLNLNRNRSSLNKI